MTVQEPIQRKLLNVVAVYFSGNNVPTAFVLATDVIQGEDKLILIDEDQSDPDKRMLTIEGYSHFIAYESLSSLKTEENFVRLFDGLNTSLEKLDASKDKRTGLSVIDEVQAKLDQCIKWKEEGGIGYDPAIDLYTRIVHYINELEEQNIKMFERIYGPGMKAMHARDLDGRI